jgi:hypothetical protein
MLVYTTNCYTGAGFIWTTALVMPAVHPFQLDKTKQNKPKQYHCMSVICSMRATFCVKL